MFSLHVLGRKQSKVRYLLTHAFLYPKALPLNRGCPAPGILYTLTLAITSILLGPSVSTTNLVYVSMDSPAGRFIQTKSQFTVFHAQFL